MDRYVGLVVTGDRGLVIHLLAQAEPNGWVAVPSQVIPAPPLPPDIAPGHLVWVAGETCLPLTPPHPAPSLTQLQNLLNVQASLVAQQQRQLQDRAAWLEEQYRHCQTQNAQWLQTQQAWQQHQTTLAQLRGELNSRRALIQLLEKHIQEQNYLLQHQQYLVQYILAQRFTPTEDSPPSAALAELLARMTEHAAVLQHHIEQLRTLDRHPPDLYLRTLARHQQAYQNDLLLWQQLCRELTVLCQTGSQPAPPGWEWFQTEIQNHWQRSQRLYEQQKTQLQQEQADWQSLEARLALAEQTAQELTQELARHRHTWEQSSQEYHRWQATYALQKELLDTLADRLRQAQAQVQELQTQTPCPPQPQFGRCRGMAPQSPLGMSQCPVGTYDWCGPFFRRSLC